MKITCFGSDSREGTYVLFVDIAKQLRINFGKFLGGEKIPVPAGFAMYIGSALGSRTTASPLARRLVRHATRCQNKPPHQQRANMIRYFRDHNLAGADFRPPSEKKLHWHIDYLLESMDAEITGLFIIRSPASMESALSRLALALEETFILAEGLGARDKKKSTHLLGVSNLDLCTLHLERKIPSLLIEKEK